MLPINQVQQDEQDCQSGRWQCTTSAVPADHLACQQCQHCLSTKRHVRQTGFLEIKISSNAS